MKKKQQRKRAAIILGIYLLIVVVSLTTIKFKIKIGDREYFVGALTRQQTTLVGYDNQPFRINDIVGDSYPDYALTCSKQVDTSNDCYLKINELEFSQGIHISYTESVANQIYDVGANGFSNNGRDNFNIGQDIISILSSYPQIRSLDISSTGIKDIEVPNKLTVLAMANNNIKQIDSTNLTTLESWDLSFNKIDRIENLDQLVNLEQLDLGGNNVTKIENLDQLVNLEQLDLSGNNITKIENLDQLVNLEQLDLSGNNISKIENLDQLVNLEQLDLSGNNITKIANIENYDDLKELNLSTNDISEISQTSLDYINQQDIEVIGVDIDDLKVTGGTTNV